MLATFYDCNQLKLNKTKTKFNITGTKAQINQTKHFTIQINNETLHNDAQIKILGFKINTTNSLDTQINDLAQKLNYRIHCLDKIKKYTTLKTRKNFYNVFVMGKLRYMAPIYLSAPAYLLKKLNTIIINAAKSTVGTYNPRISHKKLLSTCGWTDINILIKNEALKFLHKLLFLKKPKVLYNLFNIPNRIAKNLSIKNYRKSKLTDNVFLFKILPLYNSLPSQAKQLKPKGFSKYLKRKS